MKTISTIFLFLFLKLLCFSQSYEWTPLPLGDSLPTEILKDRAIWEKVSSPTPTLFKSSLTHLDKTPVFYSKLKPEALVQAEFIEAPLLLKNELKCNGNFLFKDNSKSKIKYTDKAHGFYTNSISCLSEDTQGNIYFGSESDGLAKFNGDLIQVLDSDSTFSLQEITFLLFDSKAKLWIGTKNKFGYIQDNRLFYYKTEKNLYIRGIEEDYNGNIWVSTIGEGAFCINDKSTLHYKKGLPDNEVTSVAVEKDGTMWFALNNKTLVFVKSDSVFGISIEHQGTPSRFYLDNNTLWVGTFQGSLLQVRNDSVFKLQYNSEDRPSSIYSFFRNELGLWFSVYGNGLYLLDKNGMTKHFSEKDGISENHTVDILPDKFGNVWTASLLKGVSRIEEILFQALNNQALVGRFSEIKVFKDNVWYFSNGGKTTKFTNGNYWKVSNSGSKHIPKNRHLTDGTIVGENEVWFANWGSGLTYLKENQFTYYKVLDKPKFDQIILNVQIDQFKNVIATSYSDKLYILRTNQLFDLSKAFSLQPIKFKKTFKWNSDLIYILCNQDVLLIKNGLYKFINQDLIQQTGHVQTVKEIGTSTFLFGEKGILEIDFNGEQIQFYKVDQFKGSTLNSAEVIANREFLIATNKGIFKIDLSKANFTIELYGTEYGLSLLDFVYIKKIPGKILLSGNELYEYTPKHQKKFKTPPLIEINNVKLNNQLIQLNQLLSIEQEDIITFVFNSISWGIPQEIEYQLIKNDKTNDVWKKSETPTITLDELHFGTYQLYVKSINKDGVSNVFSCPIIVKKKWFQTLWFKLLLGVTVLLLIAFYVYIRHKKALKIQHKLEFQVEEKTTELNLEKEELAKQLEDNNILLKEVHHRVKNNMQLVSSLLELQSDFATDEFSKEVLRKGNDRIKALAFAHQKLYQNEDYENIQLKDYFNQISRHLIDYKEYNVDINISDNLLIDIERGQVLGFIINELIVNSLKYAWKNRAYEKEISVSVSKNDIDFTFIYTDNGAGFPEEFSLKNSNSLGYTLIPSFVKRQLKGQLNIENNNGVFIKITFPI